MPNNQHAARLREIAAYYNGIAASWVPSYDTKAQKELAVFSDRAVALLAGAEALERQQRDLDAIKAADAALNDLTVTLAAEREKVEVAKAALRPFAESYRGTMDEANEALQVGGYLPVDQPEISITSWASEDIKWSDLERANAALARLEGL